MSSNGFTIGVESFLPGEGDWWATIYSRWMGKRFTGAPPSVAHGKGRHLVVGDFQKDAAVEFIRPFVGRPDDIRYRFRGNDTVLRPVEGDLDRLTVERV